MYVLLGLRTQLFRVEDVLESFPRTSKYIFDEENWLNDLFNEFVSSEFGFLLADLLPSIQYCSTYFLLPLSFELPTRMRNCDGEVVYEEFCSYQTVNKSNILCLLKRNRSYD
ncbi:MAG: hypothetical protein JST59_01625 [Actinobacteria bacterium]|nr:hypothetical protein [Actinomycetota bacterium]